MSKLQKKINQLWRPQIQCEIHIQSYFCNEFSYLYWIVIFKEREKSIGAGLTTIRAANQRKPEKVKMKRTISTFFNPQSLQEQVANNNGQGAELITIDDEEVNFFYFQTSWIF